MKACLALTTNIVALSFACPTFATASNETESRMLAEPAQSPSAGQGKDSATVENGSPISDIVVTATRREARLQDVPVAVTAITGALVRGSGLGEVRDLTQIVPGYVGSRNGAVSQPVIRGVGSSGVSVGDEANIATYIDGVYQPDPFSNAIELVEIERVEVLRGPQGTVFGRNATGGLINVITPDPSFKPRGRLAARYGRIDDTADSYDVRAYLTGGLTNTLAADVSALYRRSGGYIDDLVRGGRLGQQRVVDIRSKLMFEPNDDIKIILTGQYGDKNSADNAFQPFDNRNTVAQNFPDAIIPTGPWQVSSNIIPKVNYERYSLSLRTHFNLGPVVLETTSAYNNSTAEQLADSDASNFLIAQVPLHLATETISQEVRLLSSGDGPFTWLLGGYLFHLDGEGDFLPTSSTGPGNQVVRTRLTPTVTTRSYAGFAEGTYAIADDLFLTVGGRYTRERRTLTQRINGNVIAPASGRNISGKWTYRAALRYAFMPRANAYVSYGTGFKSGVYNTAGTNGMATAPETIAALEAGLKIDPAPWLRTNLALYYYDYNDLQVQSRAADGVNYVLQNAAKAKVYGGELEVTIVPTNDLNLRGSFAYTHGTYDRFPLAQTFVPRANFGGNMVVAQDVSGRNMIRAPRATFNLGADWGHDLAEGRLMLTGNLYHSSTIYYDFLNLFAQRPYTLVNGEIAWTHPDERFRISLWGKNLTNAKVLQQILVGAPSAAGIYEPPRTVGLGLEVRF